MAVTEAAQVRGGDLQPAAAIGSLRRDEGRLRDLLAAFAQAHLAGIQLDWGALLGSAGARPAPLPTYAFQRRHFWLETSSTGRADPAALGLRAGDHPLLGASLALAGGEGMLFTSRLSLKEQPWLGDHVFAGTAILPASVFAELALAVGEEAGLDRIDELTLQAPLVLPAEGAAQLQLSMAAPDEHARHKLRIHSRPEAEDEGEEVSWALNATAVLSTTKAATGAPDPAPWPPEGAQPLSTEELYERLVDAGLDHGPAFQGVQEAWRDGAEIFAEVSLATEQAEQAGRYSIHPALLDAAAHLVLSSAGEGSPELPFAFAGLVVHSTGAASLRVRLRETEEGTYLSATDGEGNPVLELERLTTYSPDPAVIGASQGPDALFAIEWKELPDDAPSLEAIAPGTGEPDAAVVELSSQGEGAEAAQQAVEAALVLAQRWLAAEQPAGSRLTVLTEGAFATTAGESADPAAAAAWGLLRSAQSEQPGRFALLDFDGSEASRAALPAAIALGAEEPQLALREGRMLAPRLVPVAADAGETPRALDPDATVLVTGATGALGGLAARHLAAQGARHLLLVSRRGPEAPGAPELQAALEELGAEARIAACDVGDRDALAGLLAEIPAEHPLATVVHAAGATDDGTLSSLDPGRIEATMAPKAKAAWNLHRLCPEAELILYSSAAGTIGSPGQGNYAAANAFLDALAQQRAAEGLPTTAIAWGLWEQESEITAALGEADRARLARGGAAPITTEQGLLLLDRARAAAEPVALAAPLRKGALRSLAAAGLLPPLMSGLVGSSRRRASSGDLADHLAAAPEQEQERVALDAVRSQVAAILGHPSAEAVDPERSFLELGFDSLAAVELLARLNRATGLQLPPNVAFDYPVPAALAGHIVESLASRRGGEREQEPAGVGGTFSGMLRDARDGGDVAGFIAMTMSASKFRPTFNGGGEENPVGCIPLASGPALPSLFCLPTIVAMSGPHQFGRLSRPFRDERGVAAVAVPGFLPGERLPATATAVVEAAAAAILEAAAGSPFALLGYSSGSVLALEIAAGLERAGEPPTGVVLLDPVAADEKSAAGFQLDLLDRMLGDAPEQQFSAADDTRLLAMGAYLRLFSGWVPPELEAPVLVARAADRGSDSLTGPEALPWAHARFVELPGDHFTILEEHAETTASAIDSWLEELQPAMEQTT
jgi:NAD(P)-dependent dehydrogenase (short-subunit alcohol dehydrogenase family)